MKKHRNQLGGRRPRLTPGTRLAGPRQGYVCFEPLESRVLLAGNGVAGISLRDLLNTSAAISTVSTNVSAPTDGATSTSTAHTNAVTPTSIPTGTPATSNSNYPVSTPTAPVVSSFDTHSTTNSITPNATTSTLNPEGTPSAAVTLATTDTSGNPISTIQVGQTFLIEALVQDLRTTTTAGDGFGVFAGYLDATYNSSLASISSSAAITAGPTFASANTTPTGDLSTAGQINEAGTFSSNLSPVKATAGPPPQVLWTIPVTATAAGLETFQASAASAPGDDVLLYGENNAVPTTDITYGSASITITGAAQPGFSITDVAHSAGTSGTTPFVFTVNLSSAAAVPVTVQYATADGTATVAHGDYTAASGTLTFAAGTTSETITVSVNGGSTTAANETFNVNLSNVSTGAVINDAQGVGTISDIGSSLPSLSITDVSQNEGATGTTTPFVFTVSLSAASSQPVTVAYATADGSATVAHGDYASTSGTLTFAAGTTSQSVTVSVAGGTTSQANENFFVNLSNSSSDATIADAQGMGTILNATAPTLSINSVSQDVGGAGTTTPFVFTVTLSAASSSAVTVQYATSDGTASAGHGDYTPASGTLTFAAGTTSQSVTVSVAGGTTTQAGETFFVNLTNPTNAPISAAGATGTGTILNAAGVPTLSINSVSQNEGNSGNTPFVFTVTLSSASAQTVTTAFATADGSATIADNDYVANSGTLTFAPGVTTQTITVNAVGDTVVEPNENFFVNLSNASVGITAAQGTGTIVNDDTGPVTASIGNITQTAAASGSTPFVFGVTLSAPSNQTVTVAYNTADGTASVAHGDYAAQSGTLTFAPGATTQAISILVNGGSVAASNETFSVNLSSPNANAVLGTSQGTATIVKASAVTPSLTIGNVTQNEGTSGTTPFVFTVSLSAASTSPVTVAFATSDGTATVAHGDYTATSGTLTFAAGTTTQTITVNVNGGTTTTANETFNVNLSSPSNATLADAQGVGTISNATASTTTPNFSINNVSQFEGTSGVSNFVFTVTLSAAASQATTVAYATADGTATVAHGDYTAANGTLTFAAGTTTQRVTVAVNGGTATSANETFSVNLSHPSAAATIGTATGTGTILGQQLSGKQVSERDFLNVSMDPLTNSSLSSASSAAVTNAAIMALTSGNSSSSSSNSSSTAAASMRAMLSDAAFSDFNVN